MRTNFRCLTLPSVHSLNLPESTVYASLGTVQFLQKSFSFMVLKAILGSNLKPSRSPPLLRFLLLVTQFPVMCVVSRRGVNHCESFHPLLYSSGGCGVRKEIKVYMVSYLAGSGLVLFVRTQIVMLQSMNYV